MTDELPSITAGERIDHIGNMSSKAIVEACDMTANDIEKAGQAALEIATVILNEAKQLAAAVRQNGSTMGKHLQEFAVLAKKVSATMRYTRAEVLNPQPEPPEKAAPPS